VQKWLVMGSAGVQIVPVLGIPAVDQTTDLAAEICSATAKGVPEGFCDGDVLVVAQKVVSKSEGRVVTWDGDASTKQQVIRGEATRIVRDTNSLIITETAHGFVCANAGVDRSNSEPDQLVLLPNDPDRSARGIRDRVHAATGKQIAVVISDSFGRPWREGSTGVALGSAGITPILDLSGTKDWAGIDLETTRICLVDMIASAAELVMPKAGGIPAVVVRGIDSSWVNDARSNVATDVIRPANKDLFR
jgi:coenzyme F420-0:L-glutamate ligase/coenzyme F420-1:gamma-L-glutamate ligase